MTYDTAHPGRAEVKESSGSQGRQRKWMANGLSAGKAQASSSRLAITLPVKAAGSGVGWRSRKGFDIRTRVAWPLQYSREERPRRGVSRRDVVVEGEAVATRAFSTESESNMHEQLKSLVVRASEEAVMPA
eukprot:4427102-Pleurochrysis_carterae.AAC.1